MPAKEADELLFLATDDFKSLKGLVEMDLVTHVVFFLAQQTVEKSLKVVLLKNNISFRKTHDLLELNNLLKQQKIFPPIAYEQMELLNTFAVDCRYGLPEVEFPDAKEVLSIAKTTIEWCKKAIHD